MKNEKSGLRQVLPGLGLALVSIAAVLPQPAVAYVGPGAGLSALGSLLALLAAVAVTIIGFIWYPIKRILGKRRVPSEPDGGQPAAQPPAEPSGDDRR
jgi:hypothetical protein